MTRLTVLCALVLLTGCSGYPQGKFVDFVSSFPLSKPDQILRLRKLSNFANTMTNPEATLFVYGGDTSKLRCVKRNINMETEKDEGLSRDEYLPSKCVRIENERFTMIVYSLYECGGTKDLVKMKLRAKLIDPATNKATDSLDVYKGDELDYEYSGLLNTTNGNFFLVGQFRSQSKLKEAILYKIDLLKTKFIKARSTDKVEDNSDDFRKTLESLAWQDEFSH
jgi:hypothetical protein